LHQLYLHKIFKLEKEQFVAEKLSSKFNEVSFEDNIKVIELIDY
jgi:predicted metallopeptidase